MDTSGLKNFISRLSKVSTTTSKLQDSIANGVANRGKEIATEKYKGSPNVTVEIIPSVGGRSSIVSKGKQVSFMEFGTGVAGKGTYVHWKLPKKTMKIEFESPEGVKQSTDGWQYNYRKEQGQTDRDWTGQPAQAQMFFTAQQLKQEIPSLVSKIIGGEK